MQRSARDIPGLPDTVRGMRTKQRRPRPLTPSALSGFGPRVWILLVVFVDQVTKAAVIARLEPGVSRPLLGPVSLMLTENSGAAFSLLPGATRILAVVGLVVVGLGALHARALHPALLLAIGGVAGNVVDRATRGDWLSGAVVDFISIGRFPIFNVADMAIVLGTALWVTTVIASNSQQR